MAFLNTLTDKEQHELMTLAKELPVVAKLCAELRTYEEDSVKGFYAAINMAIKDVTNDIHNKTLDMDTPYTKSIIKLAEAGTKIFETLSRGKQEATGEKPEENQKGKAPVSMIDSMADKNKQKL